MIKRSVLAGVLVYVAWAIMDYLLHGILLKSIYEASAPLLRPLTEMKITLINVVKVILIACFILIYQRLITTKSLWVAIQYGTIYGLATGAAAGFGTYIHSPISLTLAWAWFAAGLAKMVVAGVIIGMFMKTPEREAPNQAL
jgi:hypothetical protein